MTAGVVFLLLTFAPKVSAQQVSLGISPPLLEVLIKPGKSIMVAYNLENSGDPVHINVKMASFEPKDNLGNVRIKDQLEGPIRFNLDNSDIELNTPFFLKSLSSQQLLLRIRIPENIENGDYYYSLLAETVPSASTEGIGSAQAKATIGSNILITVTNSGMVEVKPKIALFDVLAKIKLKLFNKSLKIFDSFDKIPIVLIVENKGKNLIKPQGEIKLKGSFGLTSKYDIISKNILSQSQRLIEATPSANLNQINSTPTSLIVSGFFTGLYHLSANVNFGENSPQIFASASFFAFPFKLLFGLIIVIVGTIYIIKRFFSDQ
ncbi:MAG: hypothetical protein UR23_C0038G0003 [Candidatus Roizmanbacteria bacterium GW2011_GWA2_32_13]|uniref:DUF916 domain-containing protein n=1 Tax=Candidatus Roizmanbacteria bacterium GW2011_GWA2_32_13 TaxID=1618475 RepID=A0A0F9Z6Z6_9BACT|nr:MAG: hypothetical protein UR23_C0038G0003 [Candidatus Roizmanbacteria bacterium GW2011_GWA2_32_13]